MKEQDRAETITVYVTKYAITRGILSVEVEPPSVELPSLVHTPGNIMNCFHGEGREWHHTLEGATKKAEEMRKAELASLAKRVHKIKKLDLTKVNKL